MHVECPQQPLALRKHSVNVAICEDLSCDGRVVLGNQSLSCDGL